MRKLRIIRRMDSACQWVCYERRKRGVCGIMDTSETYKKMSDCAEIQGDSVYPTFAFRTKIFYVGNDVYWQQCYPEYHGAQSGKVKIVQLRRQDQLQEIILENKYCDYSRRSPAGRAALFSEFVYEEWFRPTKIDTSYQVTFEQLWLAFVMHEKFGKAWNGEVWEKEKGLVDA